MKILSKIQIFVSKSQKKNVFPKEVIKKILKNFFSKNEFSKKIEKNQKRNLHFFSIPSKKIFDRNFPKTSRSIVNFKFPAVYAHRYEIGVHGMHRYLFKTPRSIKIFQFCIILFSKSYESQKHFRDSFSINRNCLLKGGSK